MDRTFIFDLDDTLMPTQHHYSQAQIDFMQFMLNTFGPATPSMEKLVDMQVRTDIELIHGNGFKMTRFPESFAETYRKIARERGFGEDRIITGEKIAYSLGTTVFNPEIWKEAGFFPGAVETLDFLLGKGDDLALVTLGDIEVQQQKVEVMGMNKWFDGNVYVVNDHKGTVIDSIVSSRDRDRVWFVGNSYRSDMRPAFRAGIGTVYIPQETWRYDDHPEPKYNPRMIQLENIGKLPEVYDSGLR